LPGSAGRLVERAGRTFPLRRRLSSSRMRRMRKRARLGLTGDDEFEDVIPARASHISEGYIKLRARARLPAAASVALTPWEFVGHHSQLLFPSTNNVGCNLATILHVSCLSQVSTAGIDCCIKLGITNTPKLLLVQFASRSRRTSGSSLKREGSPP
jgi:hypothetical protein